MHDNFRFRILHLLRVLAFLGASQFLLPAQTTVLHLYHAPTPDPNIEEILYLSAGTELRRAGISSTRNEEAADYILVTEYDASGDEVEVRYTLYQTGEPRRELAKTRYRLRLNYGLGIQIAQEVERLLQMAALELDPSTKAEISGLFPDAPAAETEDAVIGEPVTATPTPVTDPKAPEDSETPETHEPSEPSEPSEASITRDIEIKGNAVPGVFDLSVSLSGLMLFGPVTRYFHYGGGGKVTAGFSWLGETSGFFLGVEAGGARVFNDEDVVGGPLHLSSAGVVLALGSGRRVPYRIAGRVSGGAAVITVMGADAALSKTVPYGEAGFHALFPLGKGYFLGGEMGFKMIFDEDLIIFGASPAFMLRKEF